MYNVNQDRIISTFTDLVSIPSPSWSEGKVISYLEKRFKRLKAETLKTPCGSSHNLLVKIPGNAKKKPVLFSAHTDTVVPAQPFTPVVTEKKITSDGTSVLGSDDKSAITMILEGIEYAREHDLDHPPVEILFSCAEEVGLKGIKCFDFSLLKSRRGIVLDSAGPVGGITTAAPYHLIMNISVTGKAAHAGIEPEKGKNAITALASIISQLPSGRLDHKTTMNVGLIEGGKAINIVAQEASALLEIRAIDKKRLKELENQVKTTARETAKGHRVQVSLASDLEYNGYTIREHSPLVKQVSNAMRHINIKPRLEICGGGSDTNIINQAGINAVNLSCGMRNIHSISEYINISDLVKGTRLIVSLLETF